MSVKPSLSAIRTLKVFDSVARLQPVGLTALARATGQNLSALQRDLLTLAEAGWIRQSSAESRAWELTHHIMTVARQPHSSLALSRRLRPALDLLHRLTDETAYLTVPHAGNFVVIDAVERPDSAAVIPPIGIVVPMQGSATAMAYLADLSPSLRETTLGGALSDGLAAELENVRARGFAINDGGIVPGSATLAVAITGADGLPMGALAVTGPSARLPAVRWGEIGEHLQAASLASAQIISHEQPAYHGLPNAGLVGLAL